MTTTTAITEQDTQSPYQWAKANLSPARYRAFDEQMRKISYTKCSPEYNAQYKVTEQIRDRFIREHLAEINQIEETAQTKAQEIDRQIQELHNLRRQILEDARTKTTKIQVKAYSTEEYKEADKRLREIGQQDTAIFVPKVKALMEKFLERQLQATIQEEGK